MGHLGHLGVVRAALTEGWERSTMIPTRFISCTTSRPSGDSPPKGKTPSLSPVWESQSWLWPLWARDM